MATRRKIEKTYLPLTTAKSKFREQHLWQLHATFTPRYWSVSQRLMDSKVRARLDFYVRLHDLSFERTARLLRTIARLKLWTWKSWKFELHNSGRDSQRLMDSKMRTRLDFWVRLHDLSSELTARLLSTRSERRDRCAVKKKSRKSGTRCRPWLGADSS